MQAAEQWLENLETNQRFAGRKQELQAEIERLIGLSFDQFRRAVMLPQGEFAAFLKAGADERATLLERMTGGEIYGRLSMAAYKRSAEEKQKLLQLQDKLGDIALLTDDECELLTSQLETTRQQVNLQQQQIEQLKQHQEVMVTADKLAQRIVESEQQLQQAQSAQHLAEPRYLQLQQYEQALPARGDFTLLAQATQQVNKWITAEQTSAANINEKRQQQTQSQTNAEQCEQLLVQKQQHLSELDPKLKQAATIEQQRNGLQLQSNELQQQITLLTQELVVQREQLVIQQQQQQKAQQQYQQVVVTLETTQSVKSLAEQQNAIKDNIHQFQQAQTDITQLQADIKLRQTTLTTIAQQQTALDQQLSSLAVQQQQLTETTAAHDLIQLEQVQDQQRQHYAAYQQLNIKLKDCLYGVDKWHEQLQQRDKLQLQQQGLTANIIQNQHRLTALAPELLQLDAQHQEVDHQLTQSRAVMNLTDYRDQLVEGEACPLCGALDHPYQQHNPQVATIISQQQQRLQQLAKQLQDAHAEQRQLTQSVAQDQQAQADLVIEIQVIAEKIEVIVSQQQCLWSDLMAIDLNAITLAEINLSTTSDVAQLAHYQANWSQAVDDATAQMQTIKTQGEQRKKLITEVKQQQQLLQKLGQQQSELKEQCHQLSQQQTQAQEQQKSLVSQAGSQQQVRDQRQQALNAIYGSDTWLSALSQQGNIVFIEVLEQQITDYQANVKQQQQLEKQVTELAPLLAQLTSDVKYSAQQLQTMVDKDQQLTQQQAVYWQQRIDLIGEQSIESIENKAKTDLEQQQQQLQQQQTQLNQLAETMAANEAHHHHAKQQLVEANQVQQQLQQIWGNWLEKLALTEPELTALLSKDEAWLQLQRAELKQIEHALSACQTVLIERQQAHADHQPMIELATQWFTDHEIGTDTSLQQQLMGEWQAQKSQLDDQVFQYRQRLAQGEQAEQQAGNLRSALATQQTQTELWLQMNELIGSATGNKFRTLAQGLTLQQLVLAANEHLQDLAPRYALQPVPGSPLALQVIDHDMGDEVRSVESLSGGESFLVSLSLALALASLAADTRQLGSLFIDEGFGTLDPESLEMALACLDALQADGRQIGVISHVSTLVERIGVQVAVEAMGGGRSQIAIKG